MGTKIALLSSKIVKSVEFCTKHFGLAPASVVTFRKHPEVRIFPLVTRLCKVSSAKHLFKHPGVRPTKVTGKVKHWLEITRVFVNNVRNQFGRFGSPPNSHRLTYLREGPPQCRHFRWSLSSSRHSLSRPVGGKTARRWVLRRRFVRVFQGVNAPINGDRETAGQAAKVRWEVGWPLLGPDHLAFVVWWTQRDSRVGTTDGNVGKRSTRRKIAFVFRFVFVTSRVFPILDKEQV